MVNIEADATGFGNLGFALTMDGGWVAAADAVAPFELRNAVLQDADVYVPVTSLDKISVTLARGNVDEALTHTIARRPLTHANATLEWRQGVNPLPPSPRMLGREGTKAGLVMLHGYCSDENPWERTPFDFTDAKYFLNPGASISNDEFAMKVSNYIDYVGLDTFGLVGHSQGGLASVHILNYYFTGLDQSEGDQRVTSVGSPYLGSSAAGSIANLGKIFGVGCGENVDLSPDGAKLWVAGLSPHILDDVYYYTTTYVRDQFFGDFCSLPMQLILDFPNDGTSEFNRAQLPGANNMGNTESECHVGGMKYPPQYDDDMRNAIINAKASR